MVTGLCGQVQRHSGRVLAPIRTKELSRTTKRRAAPATATTRQLLTKELLGVSKVMPPPVVSPYGRLGIAPMTGASAMSSYQPALVLLSYCHAHRVPTLRTHLYAMLRKTSQAAEEVLYPVALHECPARLLSNVKSTQVLSTVCIDALVYEQRLMAVIGL